MPNIAKQLPVESLLEEPQNNVVSLSLKRVCRDCNKEKEISFFSPHKGKKFGIGYRCRDCARDSIAIRRREARALFKSSSAPIGHKICTSCGCTKLLSAFKASQNFPYQTKANCLSCSGKGVDKTAQQHVLENGKTCRTCKTVRSAAEFSKDRSAKDGFYFRCNPCNKIKGKRSIYNPRTKRRSMLLSTYKLREHDYEVLLARQDHKCAICIKPHIEKSRKRLVVDHNHITGKVRGLLCESCNLAIGKLQDSSTNCRLAASYLEEHE